MQRFPLGDTVPDENDAMITWIDEAIAKRIVLEESSCFGILYFTHKSGKYSVKEEPSVSGVHDPRRTTPSVPKYKSTLTFLENPKKVK